MRYLEDNNDPETRREEAVLFESKWQELCDYWGEYRFVELLDRYSRSYGRLFLPSEVFYVWNQKEWIPSSDSDNHRNWEPVTSLWCGR